MALYKPKKRCVRCLKELRADGTCQNKECVKYTVEKQEKQKSK